MTVGELKKQLENVPDNAEIWIDFLTIDGYTEQTKVEEVSSIDTEITFSNYKHDKF